MYWSDWGSKACVSRAAMDGTRQSIIIGKVGRANGLTIDYVQHRLYWTELGHRVIESSDLDGKERAVVISENIEKPFGLTQYLVSLSELNKLYVK
jgi:low density lipoprotein receptor-related protein 5/6